VLRCSLVHDAFRISELTPDRLDEAVWDWQETRSSSAALSRARPLALVAERPYP